MIQFARAVGLELSLASFQILEDLLLKTNILGSSGGGGKASSRSVFSSQAATSVRNSVASHFVYSWPTITESTNTEQVAMGKNHILAVKLTRPCLVCLLCTRKMGPIV